MRIGIFSSTPHLWDTTIKYEVLDILHNNHSVVLIKEYDDVKPGRLEKEIIVHDLSYMNDTYHKKRIKYAKKYNMKY